ncbi:hypothetical protein FNV43_RR27313 [Rhamnella rubrinervis]|uniref:Pseudouridine synthase RsuA/RluA-like domain-containing protein n=1 Tax=Rhamnella rubrinervis TaxID=2594499 RepID=A0A8K0DQZ4_9ROSA|nr:hypothetical protein FNV43_RR27313 [Rhamnella rubrinervis]
MGDRTSSNTYGAFVSPGIVHRLDKGTSGLVVVGKVLMDVSYMLKLVEPFIRYKVIEVLASGDSSLVEWRLETGCTHQEGLLTSSIVEDRFEQQIDCGGGRVIEDRNKAIVEKEGKGFFLRRLWRIDLNSRSIVEEEG